MSTKKIIIIASGVLLFFASLWTGAYAIHLNPFDHWSSFPVFMTAFAGCVAGWLLVGWGAIELK